MKFQCSFLCRTCRKLYHIGQKNTLCGPPKSTFNLSTADVQHEDLSEQEKFMQKCQIRHGQHDSEWLLLDYCSVRNGDLVSSCEDENPEIICVDYYGLEFIYFNDDASLFEPENCDKNNEYVVLKKPVKISIQRSTMLVIIGFVTLLATFLIVVSTI